MKMSNKCIGSVSVTSGFVILTTMLFQFVEGSDECLVHPTNIVVVADDKLALECNVSETGHINRWRHGTEKKTQSIVYQATTHNGDELITEEFIADGYFMVIATHNRTILQSKHTLLTQAGPYLCECEAGNKLRFLSSNVAVVASQPVFTAADDDERNLICSISFNGSTNASFDLYIKDASGTILSNRTNLPFIQSLNDYNATYRVVFDSQDVTTTLLCEVKLIRNELQDVLYTASANFIFTHANERWKKEQPFIVVAGVAAIALISLFAYVIYRRRKLRATILGKSCHQSCLEVFRCFNCSRSTTQKGERPNSPRLSTRPNKATDLPSRENTSPDLVPIYSVVRRSGNNRNKVSAPITEDIQLEDNELYDHVAYMHE